jgi:hypothetical protein
MLKKTITPLLLVVVVNVLGFGFQRSAPWQKFNSPEGKFSVLMPSRPKLQVNDVEGAAGKSTHYNYTSVKNIGLFAVMYFDHPVELKDAAQRESRLDVIRDGVVASLGGEMISEKKIKLYGNPGREFSVRKTEQGSEDVYQWRIFLVGKRVYQLSVATERKDSGSPDVTKFFTSFDLIR